MQRWAFAGWRSEPSSEFCGFAPDAARGTFHLRPYIPIHGSGRFLKLAPKTDMTPHESFMLSIFCTQIGQQPDGGWDIESIQGWLAEHNLLRHFEVE